MTSTVTYIDNLRCEAVHLQSGTKMHTDAPTDNHGQGAAFSPTDLCATSLAECGLTTIAIMGKDRNIIIDGSRADVNKIMSNNPRKIAEIQIDFYIKGNFSAEEKTFIESTAHNCPVALSLHPDLLQTMTFHFD